MTSADNAPSVDFTVEPNVNDQKDFMTACTGKVNYATQGVQPTTSLDFRHALTAIRFAVGQNLSWNKTIDKVEIRNAIMTSKYKLSSEFNGTGADWDNTAATRGNATLSGVSVSTSRNPNVTIMGTTGDNYTFYMIPQELTGKGVTVYVHCTDGTEITAPLKGEWKAGTTRTYKLSQTNSTWTYTLTATNPVRAANYNEATSPGYQITSLREDPATHVKQAVPWKIIGYDANNDGIFSMSEKPVWLTKLDKLEGNGSIYYAETGFATLVTSELQDLLKKRNEELRNATPLGTASNPYDLSTKGGSVPRSTANCYVISAPGYYRIPLVYGNAIENGVTNSRAYISSAPATMYRGADMILHNFKDHLGNDITNPWIEKTNSGAYAGISTAWIAWADEVNLARNIQIVHNAAGDGFVQFEVKAADIKSGNAVINVSGRWSYHLWFAPANVLNKIEITNHQGVKYNLTTETLGWKYTKWGRTTYSKPRTVKVRVEQTIANNGIRQKADITITQNPGIEIEGYATGYQWGRKDALPGIDEVKQGYFRIDKSDNMSIKNSIQNPNYLYANTGGHSWYECPPVGYTYINLWSAENTVIITSGDDNPVVKTVYDPCPAGFKVPPTNIFTGFTKTGGIVSNDITGLNVDEQQPYSYGGFYWTNSNKTTTLFLPAGESREGDGTLLTNHGRQSCYWTAMPCYEDGAIRMIFSNTGLAPVNNFGRSCAFSIRPVSE